ncbi:hypothetical protein GJ744_005281 [Endocarpon pusillum]|uniref:Uncharacterized protein n=1 Tax=Endocarpon pusillum TaxID=364733 RepID=A0A8H7A4X5_9EURO|nr:hypothetical protein GJ744_005281 [Endocarpon pusillum]
MWFGCIKPVYHRLQARTPTQTAHIHHTSSTQLHTQTSPLDFSPPYPSHPKLVRSGIKPLVMSSIQTSAPSVSNQTQITSSALHPQATVQDMQYSSQYQ